MKERSVSENFIEGLIREREGGRIDHTDKELREIRLIEDLLTENEGLHEQITNNATKTIKTIKPDIEFSDFKIALSMVTAVVADALYYLKRNGHIEIKDKGVK